MTSSAAFLFNNCCFPHLIVGHSNPPPAPEVVGALPWSSEESVPTQDQFLAPGAGALSLETQRTRTKSLALN